MSTVITISGGRLASDPELRFLPSGTGVTEFRVADNERIKDKDTGQWKDGEASFFTVKAYGPMAEEITENLFSGQLFFGSGSLVMRNWTDKDGNKRTTPEITLTDCGRSLKFPAKGARTDSKPSRSAGEYESPPF